MRLVCETDHSFSSTAGVKMRTAMCPFPHEPSLRAQGWLNAVKSSTAKWNNTICNNAKRSCSAAPHSQIILQNHWCNTMLFSFSDLYLHLTPSSPVGIMTQIPQKFNEIKSINYSHRRSCIKLYIFILTIIQTFLNYAHINLLFQYNYIQHILQHRGFHKTISKITNSWIHVQIRSPPWCTSNAQNLSLPSISLPHPTAFHPICGSLETLWMA
jgi:hypothetical protein